jgi:hypothetical protein
MINLLNKSIRTVDRFGNIHYRLNGLLHRIGGPAIIYPDGRQIWCKNGKRHRIDGPAVIFINGRKDWYENNKLIKNEIR